MYMTLCFVLVTKGDDGTSSTSWLESRHFMDNNSNGLRSIGKGLALFTLYNFDEISYRLRLVFECR